MQIMAKQLVKVESLSNGIVRLNLNDPDSRNAMSEEMATEFHQIVSKLNSEKVIRVVIISGEGSAFSAGGHLDMLERKIKITQAENKKQMLQFYQQFLCLRKLSVPVIAAINGHAVGAGLCVALACDIRVAHINAKLGLNFVNIGLHPGMGATYFLPRLVGPAKTAELLYCGKIIGAKEAEALGLVNYALGDGDFEFKVNEIANAIASVGPQAISELKNNLLLSEKLSLDECLEQEATSQALDYAGAEFKEGIAAAKEKRSPRF
jgi:enoyl-CoA hydratase